MQAMLTGEVGMILQADKELFFNLLEQLCNTLTSFSVIFLTKPWVYSPDSGSVRLCLRLAVLWAKCKCQPDNMLTVIMLTCSYIIGMFTILGFYHANICYSTKHSTAEAWLSKEIYFGFYEEIVSNAS